MSSPAQPDRTARALAGLALAGQLALFCAWTFGGDPSGPPGWPAEAAAPLEQARCPLPDGADPTNLADLMEAGMNPLVSELSFALHHRRPAPNGGDVGEALIASTAALLGCIQLAAGEPPALPPDRATYYAHLMVGLRDEVAAVQLAAAERDLAGARHWFDHVRQRCARCHAAFHPSGDP